MMLRLFKDEIFKSLCLIIAFSSKDYFLFEKYYHNDGQIKQQLTFGMHGIMNVIIFPLFLRKCTITLFNRKLTKYENKLKINRISATAECTSIVY